MRMPPYFRNLPVARKLQLAGMLVGLIATLLGSAWLLLDERARGWLDDVDARDLTLMLKPRYFGFARSSCNPTHFNRCQPNPVTRYQMECSALKAGTTI